MKPVTRQFQSLLLVAIAVLLLASAAGAGDEQSTHMVRLKDISTVEGVRDNPLIGYGLVVGLKGTGDSQQTIFTNQTLGNILNRMGLTIPPTAILVHNVAAVFVTATLPPFAKPGMHIDVTVSSVGDAKSLLGGLLLLSSLNGPDGHPYALAQGPLIVGGYAVGARNNSKQVNTPTVGIISGGGIVERDTSVNLDAVKTVNLLLRDPDFQTAQDVASAINQSLGKNLAHAIDSRRIEISGIDPAPLSAVQLLARIEDLTVRVQPAARVIISERTGTIVMGGDVTLSACSILHGNLTINVVTVMEVSQPYPNAPKGTTEVVPQTTVTAGESAVQSIKLQAGSTVEDLVKGLQSIGATPGDVVSIIQAIQADGALNGELEVM
ncbi:MAG TPA: flagellar basal body P-ring protein FlgI [Candidatus Acidoferrales bacterium]|jgi:flagellar P-ring protein precursor FlgI|nr:flagellar basal body P-ring protein FlgI [Candidatus Acidoferrales bacterium]